MFNLLKHYIVASFKNEKGQGMVEYALLIALIAIVVMAALLTLGPVIAEKFTEVEGAL